MEGDKDPIGRRKKQRRRHLLRGPSRRRWIAGLAPWFGPTHFGLGVGPRPGDLFGSLFGLMPEEQATLAGILRSWAGLFVVCGVCLLVLGKPLAAWLSGLPR